MKAKGKIIVVSGIVALVLGSLVIAQWEQGPRRGRGQYWGQAMEQHPRGGQMQGRMQGPGMAGRGMQRWPQQGRGQSMGQQYRGGRMLSRMQGRGLAVRGMQQGPQQGLRRGMIMLGVLRRLDLNEEQREKVREIIKESIAEAKDLKLAVREGHKAVFEAANEGGDEAAVQAAAASLTEAIVKEAQAKVKVKNAIKAVLTEEQVAKLEAMKEKIEQARNCECECECARCQRDERPGMGMRGLEGRGQGGQRRPRDFRGGRGLR